MDIFLLPFIFSVWAAISFLFLLQAITLKCNVIWFMKCILSFLSQIIHKVFRWMSFLACKFILSYSGRFWLSILCWILIVPIDLYTFFHGVNNFVPRHCQWSFIDILFNPVPGIKFEGRTTESNDFDLLKHQRFNHNLTARGSHKISSFSAKRTKQSSFALVYYCPMANMSPIAPKLHGYQTYTTFHNTSMEHQVMDSEKNMPMTLYFAICEFSCPETVFSKLPWRPPDGFITSMIFTHLAHHVMYLMLIFSLDLRQFLNGNLGLGWAYMLADHRPMLLTFHLF